MLGRRSDGTVFEKDHLYVLTGLSLYEFKWRAFERNITNIKLELADDLCRRTNIRYDLAQCEVKSTWLRHPQTRRANSGFLSQLSNESLSRLVDTFYAQLKTMHMWVFSVVVDKRKLREHVDQDILFKKAYELLLERMENFLREYHPKHQGLVVIDDNGPVANRSLTLKHSYIQREGNKTMHFDHIVEYPMFTDSALSNGIQLADLCSYNIYRAFRDRNFSYPYFARMLDFFYSSKRTDAWKLDGLKVWPDDSDLVEFARQGYITYLTQQPTLWGGLLPEKK